MTFLSEIDESRELSMFLDRRIIEMTGDDSIISGIDGALHKNSLDMARGIFDEKSVEYQRACKEFNLVINYTAEQTGEPYVRRKITLDERLGGGLHLMRWGEGRPDGTVVDYRASIALHPHAEIDGYQSEGARLGFSDQTVRIQADVNGNDIFKEIKNEEYILNHTEAHDNLMRRSLDILFKADALGIESLEAKSP